MENAIKRLLSWLLNPPIDGPKANLIPRLMAGGVFLWEGTLKFIYPSLGIGRFTKIGFPFPVFTTDFVGGLEIVGGIFVICGFLTRFIAVPFMIEMATATLSTKIALYQGVSPLPLPPTPPQIGFAAVLHEVRSEYAQFMTMFYLLLTGPGPLSVDAVLRKRRAHDATTRRAA